MSQFGLGVWAVGGCSDFRGFSPRISIASVLVCVNDKLVLYLLECVNGKLVLYLFKCIKGKLILYLLECFNGKFVLYLLEIECINGKLFLYLLECIYGKLVLYLLARNHFEREEVDCAQCQNGGEEDEEAERLEEGLPVNHFVQSLEALPVAGFDFVQGKAERRLASLRTKKRIRRQFR